MLLLVAGCQSIEPKSDATQNAAPAEWFIAIHDGAGHFDTEQLFATQQAAYRASLEAALKQGRGEAGRNPPLQMSGCLDIRWHRTRPRPLHLATTLPDSRHVNPHRRAFKAANNCGIKGTSPPLSNTRSARASTSFAGHCRAIRLRTSASVWALRDMARLRRTDSGAAIAQTASQSTWLPDSYSMAASRKTTSVPC